MLLDKLGIFVRFGTNLRNERRLKGIVSASDASEELCAPFWIAVRRSWISRYHLAD